MTKADDAALDATRAWVERVVIAHSLCPFAVVPYEADDVLFETLPTDPTAALSAIYRRASQMASGDLPETTLLIVVEGLSSFGDFMAFQEAAESLLAERFGAQFVTATFHPAYTFADTAVGDERHFLHRSPYPVVQLLRQRQVAFAKTHGDIPALLSRNSEVAKQLGNAYFRSVLGELQSR